MKMKMKALTGGLMIAASVLSGCASHQPPIPVDHNPSKALQFARAMNLMRITDEGDNYFIYNQLSTGLNIYPLEKPVRAGQAPGKVQSAGNGLADVAAGVITNTSFIPAIGVLTSRSPSTVMDGVPNLGSWTDYDQYQDGKEIVAIVKQTLPKMDGFAESKGCAEAATSVSYMNKHKGTNGKPVDLEPERLPRPPINTTAMVKPFGFSSCLFYLASKPSNKQRLIDMSKMFGDKRALFIPGYATHPPYVLHNGQVLEFKKG
ncbi:hypothetical protein AGJ33_20765 [Cronobacter dublinensis subsp. dublinensis]|nr:hypothetical protein [Cronobacter dublinensis subsp. dublinensis]